jgi:hypothetical protein
MTDRHSGYVVTLAQDVREDEAELVITALTMIKGVVDVRPIIGGNMHEIVAQSRSDIEWRNKIASLLTTR